MAERLSPASGGPLVDPQGRSWAMRRRLDLRMVRRALRNLDQALLLGDEGGFSLRWLDPADRPAFWQRVKGAYGDPGGDYVGCEFADDSGNRIVYVELRC
jgi:hypothetical protein